MKSFCLRVVQICIWVVVGWILIIGFTTIVSAQEIQDRPEYSAKSYLTVVYSAPQNFSQIDVDLYRFLRTNTNMKKLVESTNFNEWTNNNKIVQRTNWRTFLGKERPVILLQGPSKKNGTADVIFFARGKQIKSDETLVELIRKAITKHRFHTELPTNQRHKWRIIRPDGQCPIPQPKPSPVTPAPAIVPIMPTIDVDIDLRKNEEPPLVPGKLAPVDDNSGLPLWLLTLPILAGGAGLYKATVKKGS